MLFQVSSLCIRFFQLARVTKVRFKSRVRFDQVGSHQVQIRSLEVTMGYLVTSDWVRCRLLLRVLFCDEVAIGKSQSVE